MAPGVELELHGGSRDTELQRLEEAEVDLVITSASPSVPDWCVVSPLYEERYVVLLPPGHRLETKHTVRLAELSGQPYIDRLSCELREKVVALCKEREVSLYASYRTEREDWVQSLVTAGVGLAFMPEDSLLLGDHSARPLVEPELPRHIEISLGAL